MQKKKKKNKLRGLVVFVDNEKKKKEKKKKPRGLVVFVINAKKKKKTWRASRLCDQCEKKKKNLERGPSL